MSYILAQIYLQPWCAECDRNCTDDFGRQWCDHDAWGECEGCGKRAERYDLAKQAPTKKPKAAKAKDPAA